MTGELAHASVPDLKESVGGLRDATMLKALVASWLVDVPHGDLERCRMALLDVRDALHEVAGRATDRVAPEYWEEHRSAARPARRHRRPACTRAAWRDGSRTSPGWPGDGPRRSSGCPARPARVARGSRPIAPGVAISFEEVVLDKGANVGRATRCSCCAPRPRPPSATWCWRRRPPPGWSATRPTLPGPVAGRGARPVRAAARCRRRPARRSGRPSTRPARSSGSCPSGSGSGCCRTPRSCTASPSTGTWWRPASRPRR